MPGWLARGGGGTFVSTAWRAARLIVAPATGWGVPPAPISVHTRLVRAHRSSAGSTSVSVTDSPLVNDLVTEFPVGPDGRLNVPFAHGEPASEEDEVKPKVRAGLTGADLLDDGERTYLHERGVEAGVRLLSLHRGELVLDATGGGGRARRAGRHRVRSPAG